MTHTIISYSNRKTGFIPSFSLPPVITCVNCKECSKSCYALRMTKFHKSVGKCWDKNLQLWHTSPQTIEYAIRLASSNSRFFRYFVGGDIPDMEFLLMMCRIAEETPTCRFLAFTKNYDLVNGVFDEYDKPRNLQIIFSCWGLQQPYNPHSFPTSNVIFDKSVPTFGSICGGNCSTCNTAGTGCWNLDKGERIWFYKH